MIALWLIAMVILIIHPPAFLPVFLILAVLSAIGKPRN